MRPARRRTLFESVWKESLALVVVVFVLVLVLI